MPDPRIPTPEQIRAVPVTSVRDMCEALEEAGLHIRNGGSHLRITTCDDVFVTSMPHTPSDVRALLNCRTWIARRLHEIANTKPRKAPR